MANLLKPETRPVLEGEEERGKHDRMEQLKEELSRIQDYEALKQRLEELKRQGYDVEVTARYRPGGDGYYGIVYYVVGDPSTGRYITGAADVGKGAAKIFAHHVETGKVEFEHPLPPGAKVDWSFSEYACKPYIEARADTSQLEAQARRELEAKARELGVPTDTSLHVLQFDVGRRLMEEAGVRMDRETYNRLYELSFQPPHEFVEALKTSTVSVQVGGKTIEKPLWEAPQLRAEVEREFERLSKMYMVTVRTDKGEYNVELEAESPEQAVRLAQSIVEEQGFFGERLRVVEARPKSPLEWFAVGFTSQMRLSPSLTGLAVRIFEPQEWRNLYKPLKLGPGPPVEGSVVMEKPLWRVFQASGGGIPTLSVKPQDPLSAAAAAAGSVVGAAAAVAAPFAESQALVKFGEKVLSPAVHRAAELHRTAAQQLEAAREAGKLPSQIKWRLVRDLTKPFDVMERVGAKLAGEQYVARKVEEVKVTGKPAAGGMERIGVKVKSYEVPVTRKEYEVLKGVTEKGEFLGYMGPGELKSKVAGGVQPSHVLFKNKVLDIRWGEWQRVFERVGGSLYKPLAGTGFEGKWTLVLRNPEIVYRTAQTPALLGGTVKAVAVQLPEAKTDPKVEEINKLIKMITEQKQREKVEAVQKAVMYMRARQAMRVPAVGGTFGHYRTASLVRVTAVPKVASTEAGMAAVRAEPVAVQRTLSAAIAVPAAVQVAEAALTSKTVAAQAVAPAAVQVVKAGMALTPKAFEATITVPAVGAARKTLTAPVPIPAITEVAAPVQATFTAARPAAASAARITYSASTSFTPKTVPSPASPTVPASPKLPGLPSIPPAALPAARGFMAAGKYWRVEWFATPKIPKMKIPKVRL